MLLQTAEEPPPLPPLDLGAVLMTTPVPPLPPPPPFPGPLVPAPPAPPPDPWMLPLVQATPTMAKTVATVAIVARLFRTARPETCPVDRGREKRFVFIGVRLAVGEALKPPAVPVIPLESIAILKHGRASPWARLDVVEVRMTPTSAAVTALTRPKRMSRSYERSWSSLRVRRSSSFSRPTNLSREMGLTR